MSADLSWNPYSHKPAVPYAAAVGKISQFLGIPAAITGRYDSITIMDELATARTELNRLEKKEQELLKELFAVHFAAQAQRTKVEGLIKQVPVPVDSLPNELLFQIIELSIQTALVPCKSTSWMEKRVDESVTSLEKLDSPQP